MTDGISHRVRPLPAVALFLLSAAAAAQAPPGYYATVDASSAAALRQTLHAVIDDHQRYPYTSFQTDTWDILELAEEDPSNPSRVIDVYRNASYQKQGGGIGAYNREHSWPKSYGFPDDDGKTYPYTDCHQLFLCDWNYNDARSNKPYRNCTSGCQEWTTLLNGGVGGGSGTYPGNSNWTSGAFTQGTWETWIGRRGDVARAILYMDIRYEGGVHGVTGWSEPDLRVTDSEALIDASNTGNNESVAYMGMRSTLLQWHAQDPPDARELARNDVVFAFQGNRNPFVDHPEWVDCLYTSQCGIVLPPVTGPAWINELHYDDSGTDEGEFVEVAGPAGEVLTGWSLVGYNGNGGGAYATLPLAGTIPSQEGGQGTLSFAFAGLQNGAPDGVALVDAGGVVREFLSYEGALVATGGPAQGLAATQIPLEESFATPAGHSLQRTGTSHGPGGFAWLAGAETPGAPNTGQHLAAGPPYADPYGAGSPGQLGDVLTAALSLPLPASTLSMLVDGVSPGAQVFLALSLQSIAPPLDLSGGVVLNVSLPLTVLFTGSANADGEAIFPIGVPPSAQQLDVYLQGFALDGAGANAWASSAGLKVSVP